MYRPSRRQPFRWWSSACRLAHGSSSIPDDRRLRLTADSPCRIRLTPAMWDRSVRSDRLLRGHCRATESARNLHRCQEPAASER
ncbi:hypothetical protein NY08_1243 [Rhodococcus sp. B7740]|nr:hypothetical protein NY08_1243 [Rhodococcus sp. B7740]